MNDNGTKRLLLDTSRINKHHYSLEELAGKWGCGENDIINLAINRKICLSVNLTKYHHDDDRFPPVPIWGWYHLLQSGEIASFLPDNLSALITMFYPVTDGGIDSNFDSKLIKQYTWPGYNEKITAGFRIYRYDIVIFQKEIERFTQENPAMFSSVAIESCASSEAPPTAPQEIMPVPPSSIDLKKNNVYRGQEIQETFAARGVDVTLKHIKRTFYEKMGLILTLNMKGEREVYETTDSNIVDFLEKHPELIRKRPARKK